MLTRRCCFRQALCITSGAGPAAAGSASRWETLIFCSVFPPCPSNFKCNCTELDESASGLSKASAALPQQKGESSHFRGLNQCQKFPCCLKVSDSLMIFSSLDTKAKTDLKSYRKPGGLSYTRLHPRQYKWYLFTPWINYFEGSKCRRQLLSTFKVS